ncbi:hypothetical protein [Bryobacter aggregatus]|uniref:hypothetical protein n=1 Tax=Bryobacter aggregatus TaxID=360054 RepID=UPI0004E18F60|nr:hypothetical protein [Bryobacter aggregatus]
MQRCVLKLFPFLFAASLTAQDARDIVRRAMEKDARNFALQDTYLYERKTILRFLDKNGRVEETKENLDEIFHVDGSPLERHLIKNGKRLTEKEQAAEQKRVDKEVAKIQNESPKERAKRRGETEKDRKEELEGRREVLEAFNFSLEGKETMDGRPTWKIRGDQRPGFTGKGRRADQMKKVRGHVWIDEASYELVRMEMTTTDTISFGWFLFRLSEGAHILFQQAFINNEVWLPKKIDVRADARLLGKLKRVGAEVSYDKFRKFRSESKLITEPQ